MTSRHWHCRETPWARRRRQPPAAAGATLWATVAGPRAAGEAWASRRAAPDGAADGDAGGYRMRRHSGRSRRMFLADHDMQHALERVQAAFPSFTQWAYTTASEDETSLDGCSLWGQWVLRPEAFMARHFSI